MINLSKNDEHLEDASTKERIKLVQNDSVRRWGQIIISFILIGSVLGFLAWYVMYKADEEFLKGLAGDSRVLLIMGAGAALAIFGLGRTVGKKS